MSRVFGSKLAGQTDVTQNHQDKLRELNITTAEQVVAIAAVEGGKEGLARHLGISSTAMNDMITKLKKPMHGRVIAAMEEPYPESFGFGALEPPAEMQLRGPGPFESMATAVALPTNVNYISRLPPVRSQAQRGTCVAFATTALNEDYHRYASGSSSNLSEQCLYKRCKENDGVPNAEGTYVRVAMDCLVRFGQSGENCEPYNPNPPTNQPGPHPACCTTESPTWRIPRSIQLNPTSIGDIKGALADGKVVAFSIPVYNSWYQSAAVRRTGDITMPLPGEAKAGGHAMLFVGYQDDAATPGGGYLILRNSWGTAWATQSTYGAGYGTLPYQYITNLGMEAFATDVALAPCLPRPFGPVCTVRPSVPPCPPQPVVQPCPPRPIIPPCPPRPIVPPCPPQSFIPPCPPRAFIPPCPRPAGPVCPGTPLGPGPGPGPGPDPYRVRSYAYPPEYYPSYLYSSPPNWGPYGGHAFGYGPCECCYQRWSPADWSSWYAGWGTGPGWYDPQVTDWG